MLDFGIEAADPLRNIPIFKSRLDALHPGAEKSDDYHFLPAETKIQGSYVLAFRNGVIEACDGYMFASHYGNPPVVYPNTVEKVLVERIPDYLGVATEQLQYPAVVTVGILGALGTAVSETGAAIDRDPLVFPTVLIERNHQSISTILRPVFDSLANIAGLNRSPNYDGAGEWHSPY